MLECPFCSVWIVRGARIGVRIGTLRKTTYNCWLQERRDVGLRQISQSNASFTVIAKS